jgi:hypothetical protein
MPRIYTKEAINMADKINVKLLLELRQANMSQRAIAASRHISTKFVAAVWKTGVTLKLLWHEYKDSVKDGVPVGYSKFCDDYAKYVEQNNLTNHITHKPGVVCEVDWSDHTSPRRRYCSEQIL